MKRFFERKKRLNKGYILFNSGYKVYEQYSSITNPEKTNPNPITEWRAISPEKTNSRSNNWTNNDVLKKPIRSWKPEESNTGRKPFRSKSENPIQSDEIPNQKSTYPRKHWVGLDNVILDIQY